MLSDYLLFLWDIVIFCCIISYFKTNSFVLRDIFAQKSFIRIDTASVSIRPHNSHCIVTFFLDLAGIDLLTYFFNIQDLLSGKLVNAQSTTALCSQNIRAYFLLFLWSFNEDLSFVCAVKYNWDFVRLVCLMSYRRSEILVNFYDFMFLRKSKHHWTSCITKFRDLAVERYFYCVFYSKLVSDHFEVTFTKDFVLTSTLDAFMICHVFYHSKYFHS